MYKIVDKFVEFLSTSPAHVLSPGSLGVKVPSSAGEIPSVVISLDIESIKGNGIGRSVQAAEITVKNTAVVVVDTASEKFSPDLSSFRLAPLPLRKNPSSTQTVFTDSDVKVKNVTDLSNPIDYSMVDSPAARNEYVVEEMSASIIFGGPQVEGEKLEVTHWTTSLRGDVRVERYSGLISFEVWASDSGTAISISKQLQDKIKSGQPEFGARGFSRLQPTKLECLENRPFQPQVGSPLYVWIQKLVYAFTFESKAADESSSGTTIKQIDVNMNKRSYDEPFTLKQASK